MSRKNIKLPGTAKSPVSAAGIAKKMVYRIATGTWQEGARLPSTRESATEWGVTQLTVLRAYRQLVAMGLVENRPRSGYYVSTGRQHFRLVRHQETLEKLYHQIVALIEDTTELLPSGVLRYMVRMVEERERPRCAFLECTAFQAEELADQVVAHLQVPCMPVTTDYISNPSLGLADQIRTLLTTSFHMSEAQAAAEAGELTVLNVPIVFDADPYAGLITEDSEIAVWSITRETAQCLAEEVREGFPSPQIRIEPDVCAESELEGRLRTELGSPETPPAGKCVLLSTSLWMALEPSWRASGLVVPCHYRIDEQAWPEIADALGLPLGSIG